MRYIRPFDDTRAVDTGFPGYRAQLMSYGESAVMLASHIQEGGCGPGLHYHPSDQLYYLISGNMAVQLGEDTHRIGPDTLVFIPAGLGHRNWNEGPGAETHFEMIIPAPAPGAQPMFPIDSLADIPEESRTDHPGFVHRLDRAGGDEVTDGVRHRALARTTDGVLSAAIDHCEVPPGSGVPELRSDEVDRYYLVLEGELTIELARHRQPVGPTTLIWAPAGVPHRSYNHSSSQARYLTVSTPAPR